ncbi:MAG: proline--tRNA ligase [Candidatus Hydrogenedentota bacterium]|nr:MAG: proline--tRNA ligase [Candidatus Hydrogenedentota bacterium]
MKFVQATQMPVFTAKEDPKDATVASHRLLVRAGIIRKQASGFYIWLPFGWKLHRQLEQIIREEMDKSGAVEVHLPILTTADLWKESGRFNLMGPEMMRVKDRHENEFVLAPTHEEAITDLARSFLQSYKQLPMNLYQIGTKFRDEIRPRFGLIRCREFVMKDAYSFHLTDNSLDETYQVMRSTYRKIFERVGLETIPVEADSGNMGGSDSEEFMVASEIGEETLLLCNDQENCGYRSNVEKTPVVESLSEKESKKEVPNYEEVLTPNKKSIEEVADFLNVKVTDIMKAVVFSNENSLVVAFIPGEREANLAKIQNASGENNLEPALEDEIQDLLQMPAGFIGPIGFKDKLNSEKGKKIIVLYDEKILKRSPLVCGAGKRDAHLKNVVPGRDFPMPEKKLDLSLAKEGDLCPRCQKNTLRATRGIEVGHIFKLGKKYTESLGLTVLDENGKPITPTMGCYGIGLGRTIATVVEQNHDDKGIVWPKNFSPFQIYWIDLLKEEVHKEQAFSLAKKISNHYSIYFDNRKERPGVKFNDADLIGFPLQIISGKSFAQEKKLEVKIRKTGEKKILTEDELLGENGFLRDFFRGHE